MKKLIAILLTGATLFACTFGLSGCGKKTGYVSYELATEEEYSVFCKDFCDTYYDVKFTTDTDAYTKRFKTDENSVTVITKTPIRLKKYNLDTRKYFMYDNIERIEVDKTFQLKYSTDGTVGGLLTWNSSRQRLKIYLHNSGKENVDKAIKTLSSLDFILVARPTYSGTNVNTGIRTMTIDDDYTFDTINDSTDEELLNNLLPAEKLNIEDYSEIEVCFRRSIGAKTLAVGYFNNNNFDSITYNGRQTKSGFITKNAIIKLNINDSNILNQSVDMLMQEDCILYARPTKYSTRVYY